MPPAQRDGRLRRPSEVGLGPGSLADVHLSGAAQPREEQVRSPCPLPHHGPQGLCSPIPGAGACPGSCEGPAFLRGPSVPASPHRLAQVLAHLPSQPSPSFLIAPFPLKVFFWP